MASQTLARLGLRRPIDLLLYFPLRYEDHSRVVPLAEVRPGEGVQVQVTVQACRVVPRPRRQLQVEVSDHSGRALLRYLNFQEGMRAQFPVGGQIRLLGEARSGSLGLEFIHPRIRKGWRDPSELREEPLQPVYSTIAGVGQSSIVKAIHGLLDEQGAETLAPEWLPREVLRLHGLPPLPLAIRSLHRPAPGQDLEPSWQRVRLDELMAQQLALRLAKARRLARRAPALRDEEGLAERLLVGLPFELTAGQKSAWREIREDLQRSRPAHRLIQGDVGSGKTVLAALAVAQALGSGCQAALMAPTEVLAEQLWSRLSSWLAPLGVQPRRLMGSLGAAERRQTLAGLASGEVRLVVGTQALVQPTVEFQRLGLALVDEQHRFGVSQRIALRSGQVSVEIDATAEVPHLLGMSATPIPRSLAMTFLADLDVSTLRERPPGRQPVRTHLARADRREELLDRLLQTFEAEPDAQAYWVCPRIEDASENEDAAPDQPVLRSIEETEAWLRPILGERMAVVHGRLSPADKAAEMARFQRGEARLLLATTVIEVGVDVSTARLMVIDHAERFGLAQLHQLRGRVGRGAGSSHCILVYDQPLGALARKRLRALHETDDGFELARRDLELRGPGELLGERQSGLPELRVSDLIRDEALIEVASELASRLEQDQPDQVNALLRRWAYRAEDRLSSG